MVVVRRGPRSMADPATGGTKLPVKTKMYGGRVPIQEMPESETRLDLMLMTRLIREVHRDIRPITPTAHRCTIQSSVS